MDNYELEPNPFYSNGFMSLFRGASLSGNHLPVVAKQHQFDRRASGVASEVSKVLNDALTQARVQHEHSCAIREVQFTFDERSFKVFHILEAMDSDVHEDILQRRDTRQQYTEKELWTFLQQTTSALAYAHSQEVAHRDIQPSNIFRSNNSYKVGGFGNNFAQRTSIQSTWNYLSPQQRRNFSEGSIYQPFKADMFSLGATMWEMTALSLPTFLSNVQDLDEKVGREVTRLPCSVELQGLLRSMLASSEEERPSMQQLLDYVKGFLQRKPAANSSIEPGTLMHVGRTYVGAFSFATMTWSQFPLASPIEADLKSRYVWADSVLFCCGSKVQTDSSCSKTAYLLHAGEEWTVTALPDMFKGRAGAGLWYHSTQRSIHVFGGKC